MATVFCSNGKTRTSVLLACFLRYVGEERSALDAYTRVWVKRDPDHEPEQVRLFARTPPSILNLFANFDKYVRHGRPPSGGACMLVGVNLQGVPVEEAPCLEVYTATSHLLYSSSDQDHHNVSEVWDQDRGFFHIAKPLSGDFVVMARFAGAGAGVGAGAGMGLDSVLFRYVNNTAFLPPGAQVTLTKSQVDMMPQYKDSFEEDEFLMTLVIQTDREDDESSSFAYHEPDRVLRGPTATMQGLADLSSFHYVTPHLPRLDKLLAMGYPPEAATLALQLANNDHDKAVKLMVAANLQEKMAYRLQISPRSSEGSASPYRSRGKSRSISVMSPGSLLGSEQEENLYLENYEDSMHGLS
ncbi:unnamed protein product, partial [Discosporangium mesarthrocarpum]